MAIMLDGLQTVRYTAPKTYTAPKPATTVRYTAPKTQTASANRYQAQADAYKKQQQEEARRRAEAERLAQQAAQYQQQQQQQRQMNQQRTPVTNNLTPIPVQQPAVNLLQAQQQQQAPKINLPGYTFTNAKANAQSTEAQRYQAQADRYFNSAQPDRWAADWRRNYMTTPQPDRWATGPNAQQYINNYLDYRKKQEEEYNMLRKMAWQNGPAANFLFQGLGPPVPPGFYGQPTTPTTPNYGGYGDYYTNYPTNPPNYSGGGGGGGGGYTSKPPEWWVEMVQWRI